MRAVTRWQIENSHRDFEVILDGVPVPSEQAWWAGVGPAGRDRMTGGMVQIIEGNRIVGHWGEVTIRERQVLVLEPAPVVAAPQRTNSTHRRRRQAAAVGQIAMEW